ncbi:MAG: radical SAM protein, partial [Candidatus Mariimomonas ferrooxydans]
MSDFPQSILLEPTNACNLRCRMCPIYGEGVKKSREVGFIKREVWTKALDEIGSWPVDVNLDIHGAGEPFLHPNFFDIISYAKSMNNIKVGFFCNATLLNQEKARAIIELGVDWVCFSIDGSEKEVFEHYRKGAVLEAVEENISPHYQPSLT